MIEILDYGFGNLGSLSSALEKIGLSYTLTSKAADVGSKSLVLLPGTGHYQYCASTIGMQDKDLIRSWVAEGRRVVGICVGFQLIGTTSEESEQSNDGLGILPISCKRLDSTPSRLHIGWNDVVSGSPDFSNYHHKDFYFIHQYYFQAEQVPRQNLVLSTSYSGVNIAAGIQLNNSFFFQFHPEKSGAVGRELLKQVLSK